MSFQKYLNVVSGSFRTAVKVERFNPDETVQFEFTNSICDINIDLSVNYQNGCRRSCTLTLNNNHNQFPVNFNNVWFGQKFKLWLGVYLDEKTPYYFPQGVFYISNPDEVYQPLTKTLKINGLDKWAFLDGTLHGNLSGTYQTNIGVSLYDATRSLLRLPRTASDEDTISDNDVIDPLPPLISTAFLNRPNEIWKCPYTAKVERGKTYADVLLEYATILCANIYYDANGHLVIEPMSDTADDITDIDKEVVWHFTVEEKQLLGLTQTYNFDKVYNDIIVLGNVVNGYQFKARVQNQNAMSDTCIQKIGLKTKAPIEDNQYYSDDQCKELAMYYAKVDTILQKSGTIDSTPLFHLDVNKLIELSTPNNNMSRELFLITGFTLNSLEKMSINITSVNILKDFSVVEVDAYE